MNQQVGTGTGAISQQGNVGGGEWNQDLSEGKTIGNITGGEIKNLAGGASANAINLSNTDKGTVNFSLTQESPQAIEALKAISGQALNRITDTALGSLGLAKEIAGKGLDTALQATESPTQQIGKILIPLAIIGAIVSAVYLHKKG
jgi:galactitol-specific phosphotransferase system IIC component